MVKWRVLPSYDKRIISRTISVMKSVLQNRRQLDSLLDTLVISVNFLTKDYSNLELDVRCEMGFNFLYSPIKM